MVSALRKHGRAERGRISWHPEVVFQEGGRHCKARPGFKVRVNTKLVDMSTKNMAEVEFEIAETLEDLRTLINQPVLPYIPLVRQPRFSYTQFVGKFDKHRRELRRPPRFQTWQEQEIERLMEMAEKKRRELELLIEDTKANSDIHTDIVSNASSSTSSIVDNGTSAEEPKKKKAKQDKKR
jgi:hypothetical protein